MIWKKGEDPIDITLPKYAGSSVDGDSPVLCINNVEEEDGADYTIEVQNEMGKAIGSRTVQVLGGKINRMSVYTSSSKHNFLNLKLFVYANHLNCNS